VSGRESEYRKQADPLHGKQVTAGAVNHEKWPQLSKFNLEVPLVGGLGNQLFILAFALHQKLILGNAASLKQAMPGFGNKTHSIKLMEEIDNPWGLLVDQDGWGETIGLKAQRILAKSMGENARGLWGLPHQITEIDFAKMSLRARNENIVERIRVMGYFQKFQYLEELQHAGHLKEIRPKIMSNWYLMMRDKISTDKSIAIHVRRGDFLSRRGPGSLSLDFYREALQQHFVLDDMDRVVVFSDSISEVREEFSKLTVPVPIHFIFPPNHSSVAESLSLMSLFPNLIMSNSTFSWWAATTGNLGKKIISPDTWSQSSKDSPNLVSDKWIRSASLWM